MWPVSSRFLEALRAPHKTVTQATVTPPGGDAVTLEVKACTVSADASSRVRRSGDLTVVGGLDVFNLLSTPGAVVRVLHGLNFGSTTELIPVFTGELSSPAQPIGVGEVRANLVDLGERVSRTRFLTPYVSPGFTSRQATIVDVVDDAIPGISVVDTSTSVGQVGAGRMWEEARWDVINDLAVDGNLEVFFGPDGSLRIKDAPSSTASPGWSINAGDGGVLIDGSRQRPLDRLFNTAVVRPSASDGTQSWVQQVVTIDDPGSPLSPSRIGTVPFFYASPTIPNATDARRAAVRILQRQAGLVESFTVACVANAALEINDVVRIITPSNNVDPATAVQHFVDAFSFDLTSGRMRVSTRLQGVQVG